MTRPSIEQKPPSQAARKMFSRMQFAAVAVVTGLAVISLYETPHQSRLKSPKKIVLTSPEIRKVYPYSVIPGGLRSAVELRQAVLRDRVVANHYAGFDVSRARIENLTEAREVYVSYRIDERVYWTRKRLRLSKGETIVTDGVNSARTRCGNRIADSPQRPFGAEEPSEEALDSGWSAAEATPLTEDFHILGRDRIGRGVVPPNDYLAAFGPTIQPSTGPVGGGRLGDGGGPAARGAPTGNSPGGGNGPGGLIPPLTGELGKPISPSITHPGGSWLPTITTSPPIYTPVRSGAANLVLPTDIPSLSPLVPPTLLRSGSGVPPAWPVLGLSVNPINPETSSRPLFYLSLAREAAADVLDLTTQLNKIPANTGITPPPQVNIGVNVPEPGTIVVSVLGIALLLVSLAIRFFRAGPGER